MLFWGRFITCVHAVFSILFGEYSSFLNIFIDLLFKLMDVKMSLLSVTEESHLGIFS